jgi:hypothetical protein
VRLARVTYPNLIGWTQRSEAGAPWERFEVPTELDVAMDEARGRALPSGTVVVLSSSSEREYRRNLGYASDLDDLLDGPMDILWEGVSLGGSAAEDAPPFSDNPELRWVTTWGKAKGGGAALLPLLARAPRSAFVRGVCAVAAMCLDPNQPGAEGKAARDALRRSLEVAEKWSDGGVSDEAFAVHVEKVGAFDYDFARVGRGALEAARHRPSPDGPWAHEWGREAARVSAPVTLAKRQPGVRSPGRAPTDIEVLREQKWQGDAVRSRVALGEVMLGHALAARGAGVK